MIIATHAIDKYITLRHRGVMRQHFESRRLSGSVDAQQSKAFAFFHRKIDAIDRREFIVALSQVRHDDCVFVKLLVAHQ